jgi:hypothetical protein
VESVRPPLRQGPRTCIRLYPAKPSNYLVTTLPSSSKFLRKRPVPLETDIQPWNLPIYVQRDVFLTRTPESEIEIEKLFTFYIQQL